MDKVAVIDIGSNALRLSIGNQGKEYFYHRFPLRLGKETFNKGFIGQYTINKLIRALDYFLKIVDENEISTVKAFATSAIRDAKNKTAIINRVREKLNLPIHIIDGKLEAKYIYDAVHSYYVPSVTKEVLMMDIGGGSVELIAHKNKRLKAHSYKMGTVRLLSKSTHEINIWDKWIKLQLNKTNRLIRSDKKEDLYFIGTGGNVRRIGRLAQMLNICKKSNSMSFESLLTVSSVLQQLSPRQRQLQLGLKNDRADVILPACIIISNIMELYKIKRLDIPNVGLKNGLMLNI